MELNVTSNKNKDNIRFGVKMQPLSNEQRIAHDNDVMTILQYYCISDRTQEPADADWSDEDVSDRIYNLPYTMRNKDFGPVRFGSNLLILVHILRFRIESLILVHILRFRIDSEAALVRFGSIRE